ncbi:MAG: hypothetical protein F7C34_02065 [Desulfurococcales archaeon]|nr:hypothetical protein [Desulfurococcales archaeon]
MARSKRKSKSGKSGSRGEIGGKTESIILFATKHASLITAVLLIAILAAGIYIRILPALKYKLELDASDPWIVYWEAKYFAEHGLFNFEGLKHVDKFWWPYGRNFLKSEYLGTAWLAAATYPIGKAFGLTLREWLALFPVFAGAAAILLSYVFVKRVTGSRLGGLVAAAFFAFFPGSVTRTTVGFVEKIAIAIPFILTFMIFMFDTVRMLSESDRLSRKALIYSALAGIFGGLVAFFWGGFIFVILVYALTVLMDPLIGRPSIERLKAYTLIGVLMILVMVASPKIGVRFFITNIGAAIPGVLALYAVEAYASTKGLDEKLLGRRIDFSVQLWIISVLAVLAAIAIQSGIVGAENLRYAAALGIRKISPLVESIQENQPASFQQIFKEYGIALLLGLAGLVIAGVRVVGGNASPFYKISRTVLYLLMLFAVYINKQLAYFTQISSFFVVIAGGVAVADIIWGVVSAGTRPSRASKPGVDPMKAMAGIFIVLIVVVSGLYYGNLAYKQNSLRAPQILTSGLGPLRSGNTTVVPLNRAWLNAFAWIRNNTSPDAVIISWWDYGYWITVNTDRRTVADGVTFNETQIRWLAELLTGNESTAVYMLKKFRAAPGDTYVVFYEVFNGIFNRQNGNVTIMYPMLSTARRAQGPGDIGIIVHGAADFGKSVQMLRISYRIDPFDPLAPFDTVYSSEYIDAYGYRYKHFPGFIGKPEKNVTTVLNTLLYQMALNAIPRIPEVGIFDRPQCAGIFHNSTLVLPYVVASLTGGGQLSQQPVLAPPLKYFKPVAVSVGCPVVREDPNTGTVSFTAVLVFIYQYTG